jgi:chemotaxis protein CheY-P-specific phosphatase CheC
MRAFLKIISSKTYHALCQVLGRDTNTQIPIPQMMMVVAILNMDLNREFYFSSFMIEKMHKQLVEIKGNSKVVHLK